MLNDLYVSVVLFLGDFAFQLSCLHKFQARYGLGNKHVAVWRNATEAQITFAQVLSNVRSS